MVFLMGMPLAAAFGNYFLPLMIGARDVAFPRLNMFGYWVFLFGGIFIYSSFVLGGAPDGGWFGYAPLTSTPMSQGFLPGRGADFWAVGLIMLGIGSVATAVNFIVTALNMRAPGMTMMKMPVFVWMMLVVAFLTLFAMPPLTAALIQVFMDRNFHTNFFNAAAGGDPLLYQNLFWIFGHPEVYILILPGMAIVSEILPVFSRKPLFGYSVVVFSGIAIGFLGWGVWAHHMFATGIGPVATSAFALSTMLIGIPTGVKIFNWLATVWGGSVRLRDADAVRARLHRAVHDRRPLGRDALDRARRHAADRHVLRGRALPLRAVRRSRVRDLRRHLLLVPEDLREDARRDAWASCNFWLMVIGFNLTFFPMHFLGMEGEPRRTYTYPKGMGWDALNLMATIGAFIIALAVLVFLVNVIFTPARGEIAPEDPWDARTLEWMTSSPPPEYNFAEIPIVEHRDEFWHRKYTEDDEGRLVKLPRERRGRRSRPGATRRAAQHPHAVAVVLAVRARARVCRSWATASCSSTGGCSGSARWSRSSGSTRGRRSPRARRRTDGADRRRHQRAPTPVVPHADHAHADQHGRQQQQARRSGCSSRRRRCSSARSSRRTSSTAAATRCS